MGFRLIPVFCVVGAAILLSACATSVRDEATATHGQASVDAAKITTTMREGMLNAHQTRIRAQDVDKPYLVAAAIPLSREVAMPELLKRSATVTSLSSRSPIDFAQALQQLSTDTGLTIAAAPDALAPLSMFGGKSSATNAAGGQPGAAGPSVLPPMRVVLIAESRPIWQVLDDLAAQSSTSWRPTAGGAQFYRLETRTYALQGAATTASSSAGLGRTGGNALFSSDSKTSFDSKTQGMLATLGPTVDALLTNAGKYSLNVDSATLVVTDTPEALARVEAFVKEQNILSSRRIRILLDTIEVIDKRGTDVGLDWNAIATVADAALTTRSLATLVSTQAAGNVTMSSDSSGAVVARALADTGMTVTRRSFPLLTTNGRPVSQAIRTTFSYVDSVGMPQTTQQASSATASTSSTTVSQKNETTGTFVTLQPTAKSDGTIYLQISIDVTSAQPLVPFVVGTGSSAVQVQQLTVDGAGSVQEVPVRSGQTVLVGGLETSTLSNNKRRLGEGWALGFGGSDTAKVLRNRTVILVTAIVEDNI